MNRASMNYILDPLRCPTGRPDYTPGMRLGEDERFWTSFRARLAPRLGEVFGRFQEITGRPAHELVEGSVRAFTQTTVRKAYIALRRRGRLAEPDRRYLDDFFRLCIGREPTPAVIYAFYRILRRSRRWRDIRWHGLIPYIRDAVWSEVPRLEARWEFEGVLPRRRLEKEIHALRELDDRRTHPALPDEDLIRKETTARLCDVLTRLSVEGTARDRKILNLLEEGFQPSEMVSSGAITWSDWQGFQRKARRWLKQQTATSRRMSNDQDAA